MSKYILDKTIDIQPLLNMKNLLQRILTGVEDEMDEIEGMAAVQAFEVKESTEHRKKFQDKGQTQLLKGLVETVNVGIRGYNATIAKIPGCSRWSEIDPNQSVAELAESGGSSLTVGLVDDGLKFIRRVVIPKIQAAIGSVEFAVDHLKDLMTSTAISGLAAEVGDLKDGQAKLNAKVDAQGKLMNK
ncbi:18521_t:CDS:2 [Funneliformis geosporum]|uniref:18521_t:CDS:1 n=1 Tax=Funneliformis geosporum TaxID=1117311 RepID=A0A9W4SZF7_9GLOM|nr:18521_t:CDS:2 [Funneliformis geosporum]